MASYTVGPMNKVGKEFNSPICLQITIRSYIMKYYVLSRNTHSNRGKVILTGPFVEAVTAEDTLRVNSYKWGSCFIERLSDNIANLLKGK